jgi:hypothetical protein
MIYTTPASANAASVWEGWQDIPPEQLARIAARRAFVEMKHSFMRAAGDVDGPIGTLLCAKVRRATEPAHLWRLRAVLLASLPDDHERTPIHRMELHRQLDSLFGDSAGDVGLTTLEAAL